MMTPACGGFMSEAVDVPTSVVVVLSFPEMQQSLNERPDLGLCKPVQTGFKHDPRSSVPRTADRLNRGWVGI